MRIFLIPSFREKYCRLRFFLLVRTFKLKSELGEYILHADYSRSHFANYSSVKERVNYLINRLSTIRDKNFTSKSILSIGPRYESEIYGFYGLGFKRKNIMAIDSFSYSPLIRNGDMHKIPFAEQSFDYVVCGWTIAYSSEPRRAIGEMFRVLKPKGIVLLTWDFPSDYNIFDLSQIKLYLKRDIHNHDSFFAEINMLDLVSKLFRVLRIEVGYLKFNSNTPFATLILEKI